MSRIEAGAPTQPPAAPARRRQQTTSQQPAAHRPAFLGADVESQHATCEAPGQAMSMLSHPQPAPTKCGHRCCGRCGEQVGWVSRRAGDADGLARQRAGLEHADEARGTVCQPQDPARASGILRGEPALATAASRRRDAERRISTGNLAGGLLGAGIPGGTPRSGDPGRADGDPLRVFYLCAAARKLPEC